jgi:hypothetical protein
VRTWRGSRDRNHAAVAAAFEQCGCSVVDTALAGIPDFPDMVVGCVGVDHLVEVKNLATRYGRAGLTAGQGAFARDWRGAPVVVVYAADLVPLIVQRWRRMAARTPRTCS